MPRAPAGLCRRTIAGLTLGVSGGSRNRNELDFERERRARWDLRRRPFLSITERRRDDEPALAAHAHPADPLLPTVDDQTAPEHERERAARVRVVEGGAVVELP